jgi:hypothetical protein
LLVEVVRLFEEIGVIFDVLIFNRHLSILRMKGTASDLRIRGESGRLQLEAKLVQVI